MKKSASNHRKRRTPSARRSPDLSEAAEAASAEASDLYAAFSNAAKPFDEFDFTLG